jgi:hypothetical protein
MEQCLQRPRVGGAGRADQDLGTVLQLDLALLVDGVCGLGGEVLLSCLADFSSSSRQRGCAISISATPRSRIDFPNRYAMPYSVTT